ncbi:MULTISPECIES: DNA primase [Thioalkalivibrio]|uniref:DNA primase n=1 Tax=Thioalkalivibrio halophilus TaxID=252474 RepID=A0A1V2ZWE4_9GAMM|nr:MULTISPECIES: DNA primase [Thioalkalivibrio]OOC09395.1 DNA primase [Thioalkalivibrio halophilus]
MAGRIPQAFIDELLERTDIVEVVRRRVSLKKAGSEYAACCPFHGEKTPSFYVSPQKQFYHCFGCGVHGTAIGFLMDYENLAFPEAVEQLAEQAGLEVPRENDDGPRQDTTGPLYAALEAAADYYVRQLRETPRAVDYLKNRGIDGATARDFRLGWAPKSGLLQTLSERFSPQQLVDAGLAARRDNGDLRERFRARIMFPIRDRRGRVTGFGGRLIDDGEPKYLNSPESTVFHKGQTIYGLFEARRAQTRLDHLVVVEGYMDVVALARSGYHRAVACMGTALGRSHFDVLFRQVGHLTLCFDGDAAGRRAASRALEQALPVMQGMREVRFLFLPEGDDPDSLVRREGLAAWERLLEQALPLSEALVRLLREEHPTETAEGRTHFAHAAVRRIATARDPLFRELLCERVAEESHLPRERLEEQLQTETASGSASYAAAGAAGRATTGPASPPEETPSPYGPPVSRPRGESAPSSGRRSTTLWAALLARILQHPELDWDTPALRELAAASGEASGTLGRLLEALGEQPRPDTARLLERFREHPRFERLLSLASAELHDGEDGMTRQVALDAADQLLRRHCRERIRELTASGSLDTEQRDELARLTSILQG